LDINLGSIAIKAASLCPLYMSEFKTVAQWPAV